MKNWMWCLLLWCGCSPALPLEEGAVAWDFDLPGHFPQPIIPEDNPLTEEKVELGHFLFYDKRLSVNGTTSCGTCHIQALGFSDGLAHSKGATGEETTRNSMGLTNVVYGSRFTWSSHLVGRLEHQAMLPMFGEIPVEMGLSGEEDTLVDRLEQDPFYKALFEASWPGDGSITLSHITDAIAAFERTLVSSRSPYDLYLEGDKSALSPSALRGMELFLSERLECFHCHGGFNFSDVVDHSGLATPQVAFHNTGLYNLDGKGRYPSSDPGLYGLTGKPEDMGKFKAPTLRNIEVTGPYMHDGSIATLEDVLDHYAMGGRDIESGPNQGSGSTSPLKSEFVAGFVLTDTEKKDVITFLKSLTDEAFLTDPEFSDPFTSP